VSSNPRRSLPPKVRRSNARWGSWAARQIREVTTVAPTSAMVLPIEVADRIGVSGSTEALLDRETRERFVSLSDPTLPANAAIPGAAPLVELFEINQLSPSFQIPGFGRSALDSRGMVFALISSPPSVTDFGERVSHSMWLPRSVTVTDYVLKQSPYTRQAARGVEWFRLGEQGNVEGDIVSAAQKQTLPRELGFEIYAVLRWDP